MQYVIFSLLAVTNFWAASVDNTPFPYRADMRGVEESSNMGLSAIKPSLKNFAASVSPHRLVYYSVFTVDDDVTGLELGYHPPLETKNFRLGLSAGAAKPQGERGLGYKYPAAGVKLETGWGPAMHYIRTNSENLFFITYRFYCVDGGKW